MVLTHNSLSFAGRNSLEWDIGISGTGTYDAPERDVELVTIPGRSGSLLIDHDRFLDIEVTYPAYIARTFSNNFDSFRAFMMSQVGYQRLEDTYHPDEFRMALCKGPIEADVYARHTGGAFDLVFICKPQRWLKSGDVWKTYTAQTTIINPTMYPAKPLLRVYGYGQLGLGGGTITIAQNANPYVEIDCELEDAYYNATNCNSLITRNTDDFPSLPTGTCLIQPAATITRVDIKGRWFTI